MEPKISENFLAQALTKWGDKWWFKASLIAIIVYFISAPIITTVITNSYQSQNISQSITEYFYAIIVLKFMNNLLKILV